MDFIYAMLLLHFNSIKVRLEQQGGIGILLQGIFQFHKGAIRTERQYMKQRLVYNFNSIKVRLEPYPIESELILNGFQFHKGAIRTESINTTFEGFDISIP